jgi:hypothetical protein
MDRDLHEAGLGADAASCGRRCGRRSREIGKDIAGGGPPSPILRRRCEPGAGGGGGSIRADMAGGEGGRPKRDDIGPGAVAGGGVPWRTEAGSE